MLTRSQILRTNTHSLTGSGVLLMWSLFRHSHIWLRSIQLNHIWEFPVDNNFATNVVDNISTAVPSADGTSSNITCTKCRQLEFWTPHFSIVDKWDKLEAGRHTCDFCRIRWQICSHLDRQEFPVLRFNRVQSMLKLNGTDPPALSIRRGRGETYSTDNLC